MSDKVNQLFFAFHSHYICKMKAMFRPNPNSFKNTFCVFKEVDLLLVQNLTVQFQSKSGSSYYYTEQGMYRLSNHWGRLANSKWRLQPMQPETIDKKKLGFAAWDSFFADNNEQKLYYLDIDYERNVVNYQHKNNSDYDNKAILRTTFETSKRIKQIRNILNLTSWAKYFDYDNIDDLRRIIINELIYTNNTLDEIKRKL